jgi:hypothetical protein
MSLATGVQIVAGATIGKRPLRGAMIARLHVAKDIP